MDCKSRVSGRRRLNQHKVLCVIGLLCFATLSYAQSNGRSHSDNDVRVGAKSMDFSSLGEPIEYEQSSGSNLNAKPAAGFSRDGSAATFQRNRMKTRRHTANVRVESDHVDSDGYNDAFDAGDSAPPQSPRSTRASRKSGQRIAADAMSRDDGKAFYSSSADAAESSTRVYSQPWRVDPFSGDH
jgi:hypothetical protein